jgi:hypothetical protein
MPGCGPRRNNHVFQGLELDLGVADFVDARDIPSIETRPPAARIAIHWREASSLSRAEGPPRFYKLKTRETLV